MMDRNDFVGKVRRHFSSDALGIATYTKEGPECWLGIVVCTEVIECISVEDGSLAVEAAVAKKRDGEWVLSPLGRGKHVSEWYLFPENDQELAVALCEYLAAYGKPGLGGASTARRNIKQWEEWARLWRKRNARELVAKMAKKLVKTDARFDLTLVFHRKFYHIGFITAYLDVIDEYCEESLFPEKRAEIRDFLS